MFSSNKYVFCDYKEAFYCKKLEGKDTKSSIAHFTDLRTNKDSLDKYKPDTELGSEPGCENNTYMIG